MDGINHKEGSQTPPSGSGTRLVPPDAPQRRQLFLRRVKRPRDHSQKAPSVCVLSSESDNEDFDSSDEMRRRDDGERVDSQKRPRILKQLNDKMPSGIALRPLSPQQSKDHDPISSTLGRKFVNLVVGGNGKDPPPSRAVSPPAASDGDLSLVTAQRCTF